MDDERIIELFFARSEQAIGELDILNTASYVITSRTIYSAIAPTQKNV